jgi:NhaP-type Na+/H+ or K+/H+ antiporter
MAPLDTFRDAMAAAAAFTAAVAASAARVAALMAAIAAFMASTSRFMLLRISMRDAKTRHGHVPASLRTTFTSLSFIIRYEYPAKIVTNYSQVIHNFPNAVNGLS